MPEPPRDPECVFCKIVAGEIPAQIVARTGAALAFLDVAPLADGHAMVVPVHHHTTLPELCPQDLHQVFELAQRVAAAQRAALGAQAVTLGINDGAAAGQVVPHLHVHLVPRRPDDGAGNLHGVFPTRGEGALPPIAARLREHLAR